MFTSNDRITLHLIGALAGTVFLAVFGAVYEVFSHGVYSYFMIYAFFIPLVMGVIPYTALELKGLCPGSVSLKLWNAAMATLATGSLFKGVLEIYGTTNSLVLVYPAAGGLLALLGLSAAIFPATKRSAPD